MLVAASRPRLLYFLLTVSVLIFCYFGFVLEIVVRPRGGFKRESKSEDKKIVAFSFLKQIEIESEEIKCEKILGPRKLKSENFNAKRWIRLEGTDLFVYSVYKDSRLHPYEYVRIIGMIKGGTNSSLFCQISTTNGTAHVTKAIVTNIWSRRWNQNDRHTYYNPYLISCHVPVNATPIHVSLSEEPCEIHVQKFLVGSTAREKFLNDTFTICVKPLNFDQDISERLLQWIVINQILGATKIEFYIENLHNRSLETLKKLEKVSGVVLHHHNKIDYNFTPSEATYIWQKRRYEIITYNDCFYRNIHTSQYVIPIDIDEIIVPRHVPTWAELLHEIVPKGEDNFASYTVRNAYYLRQFNMKQPLERVFFFMDVVRSEFSDEGESGKSFVSTKNALTVFNHYALDGVTPAVGRNKFLKNDLVQMNHYKSDCDIVILPECAKYLSSRVRIVDGVVLKYRKEFYERYRKMFRVIT